MATFKNQVQGLTQISIGASSAPTEDELSQFLQDGLKDVINKITAIRPIEAFKFTTESLFLIFFIQRFKKKFSIKNIYQNY